MIFGIIGGDEMMFHSIMQFCPQSMQMRFLISRLVPAFAAACALALLVYLGFWQLGKADRRSAELTQHTERAKLGPYSIDSKLVDTSLLQDARVSVRGHFEPQDQFFVDNKQEDGKPGVHVVTPLKIEGSVTRILVNRGWAGWVQGRQVLPTIAVVEGAVEVSGVANVPVNKNFFLMPEHAQSLPQLWSRLDIQRFAAEHNYPVQPMVILQASTTKHDGLIRNWQPPEDRVAKHQSYAYQWFSMALALLVFIIVASVRTTRNHD
jgi:surfeit locus 1 family protein